MIKQAGSKLCQDQLNFNCQNPNQTLTQPVGLYPKMTLHTSHPTPPPPTETQCQQYLSCYWTDFDEIFKVGSWEHLEQIPTVHATFVLVTIVHIMNISTITV